MTRTVPSQNVEAIDQFFPWSDGWTDRGPDRGRQEARSVGV